VGRFVSVNRESHKTFISSQRRIWHPGAWSQEQPYVYGYRGLRRHQVNRIWQCRSFHVLDEPAGLAPQFVPTRVFRLREFAFPYLPNSYFITILANLSFSREKYARIIIKAVLDNIKILLAAVPNSRR
jgi:hypothetical protein